MHVLMLLATTLALALAGGDGDAFGVSRRLSKVSPHSISKSALQHARALAALRIHVPGPFTCML